MYCNKVNLNCIYFLFPEVVDWNKIIYYFDLFF